MQNQREIEDSVLVQNAIVMATNVGCQTPDPNVADVTNWKVVRPTGVLPACYVGQ